MTKSKKVQITSLTTIAKAEDQLQKDLSAFTTGLGLIYLTSDGYGETELKKLFSNNMEEYERFLSFALRTDRISFLEPLIQSVNGRWKITSSGVVEYRRLVAEKQENEKKQREDKRTKAMIWVTALMAGATFALVTTAITSWWLELLVNTRLDNPASFISNYVGIIILGSAFTLFIIVGAIRTTERMLSEKLLA